MGVDNAKSDLHSQLSVRSGCLVLRSGCVCVCVRIGRFFGVGAVYRFSFLFAPSVCLFFCLLRRLNTGLSFVAADQTWLSSALSDGYAQGSCLCSMRYVWRSLGRECGSTVTCCHDGHVVFGVIGAAMCG